MERIEQKKQRRLRRRKRVRKRVYGTAECPRLTIFRSLKNIYAQLVDDDTGCTIAEASTRGKEFKGSIPYGGNVAAAAKIGELIGQRALAKGVAKVAFDRNGYRYHGRVKALAQAARKAGLKI